mmetsp:Transcript_39582/g.102478  ORF Transcript_39582/g.102478 Transcript_39582/m.102478 type:complete len:216 (-) Transcript_39582:669-1316(-)
MWSAEVPRGCAGWCWCCWCLRRATTSSAAEDMASNAGSSAPGASCPEADPSDSRSSSQICDASSIMPCPASASCRLSAGALDDQLKLLGSDSNVSSAAPPPPPSSDCACGPGSGGAAAAGGGCCGAMLSLAKVLAMLGFTLVSDSFFFCSSVGGGSVSLAAAGGLEASASAPSRSARPPPPRLLPARRGSSWRPNESDPGLLFLGLKGLPPPGLS